MENKKGLSFGKIKFNLKKFLPILMALTLVVMPFIGINKAFAYSGGLLNGKTLYRGSAPSDPTYTTTIPTDGNLSNSVTIGDSGSPTDTFWYAFPSPVNISAYQLLATIPNGMSDYVLGFYDASGVSLGTVTITNSSGTLVSFPQKTGVSKVALFNMSSTLYNVNEFDVFSSAPINHDEITSLTVSQSGTNANISYTIPSSKSHFTGSKIYRDGTLIKTQSTTANSYVDTNLPYNSSLTYKVTATYDDGFETTGVTKSITTLYTTTDVTNVTNTPDWNRVTLNWTNPITGFGSVNIYRDGALIGNTKDTNFIDGNVSPTTNYAYVLKAVSTDGIETNGVTQSVTTKQEPPPDDVTSVNVAPDWNKVKLTWQNPSSVNFSAVNIYRDGQLIGQTSNGSFTDTNVSPSTNYNYVLKATSKSGIESNGVNASTRTKSEPPPVITGASFSPQPNGSYKVSWQQPTTGKVLISIDGKAYKTVDASALSYTIPSTDIKSDTLGNYKVSLQPISEYGTPGEIVKSEPIVKTPFSVTDLIGTGNNLLWLIAPFLLLALAFLLVPKLRKLIISAFKGRKKEEQQTRRAEQEPKEKREREQRERREGKEYLEKVGLSPGKEPKAEREQRERQERQQRNRELKEFTELATKEPGNPSIRAERAEKGGRVQRITKTLREPRERIRQARERNREQRESTRQPRQPRQPRGSRGDY